jgi:hypothetical protein
MRLTHGIGDQWPAVSSPRGFGAKNGRAGYGPLLTLFIDLGLPGTTRHAPIAATEQRQWEKTLLSYKPPPRPLPPCQFRQEQFVASYRR